MYYEVKSDDPEHVRVKQHIAMMVGDYMKNLGKFRGVKWAQNCVALSLVEGAASIAASMGMPLDDCIRYFTENYRARREELKAAHGGSLYVPDMLRPKL